MCDLIGVLVSVILITIGAGGLGFIFGYRIGFEKGQYKVYKIVRRMTCYPDG